ncbi:MAG: molybdopterin molybdotransferase MoeA [Microbacterium sp.]
MITVEEHLGAILRQVRRLESETVSLREAAQRTLAAPVVAAVDIPPFDNSAMDGFAVRFEDVTDAPVTLTVVADVPAGSPLDPPMHAGEASRIMTGAPVPTDADAIVPFEETAGGLADSLGTVTVETAPARRGMHIRRRGDDLVAGDEVMPAGILLGPLQLGAAAAAGIAEVTVSRAPRVAIISTGDELVSPGLPLERGQIPESNAQLLAGLVRDAGAQLVLTISVTDDPADFRAALQTASECDAIITSGGVSAGAYEVVKQALTGEIDFVKVAMQPGKPQAFGRLDSGALLFGLPGNPVSVAVSFEVFVRPALLAMQGRGDIHRSIIRLPAATGWSTSRPRRQYLPVAIDRTDAARWTIRPATAGGSKSHLAGGLAQAEAYAVIPAELPAVATGDLVDVLLLS